MRPTLDQALEIVTPLEYAPPARYVNHGPMACEALTTLGVEAAVVVAWARAMERSLVEAPGPAAHTWGSDAGWSDRLGDRRLLPEWLAYLDRQVAEEGWRPLVAGWVPRLMPGLGSALYHGVIRTSHAVRSLEAADTPARRAELVQALANWATWYRPGAAPGAPVGPTAVDAAARGAGVFVDEPTIFHLHGVTGAMAVDLLATHLSAGEADAALAQLSGDHDDLYGPSPVAPVGDAGPDDWPALIEAAATSRDPHQVKLVEACRRAQSASGDPVFALAAQRVTGLEPARRS